VSLPSEPAPYSPAGGAAASPKKTKAILSVVFGAVSILFSLFLPIIWILLGIAGVILGFLARKSEPAAGKLPTIGIILSFIGIAVCIVSMILGAVLAVNMMQQQGM
jgi:ABC-type multidrug transport system fused ATPase/permease subunit